MACNTILTKIFTVQTFLWTAKQFVNCKLAASKMLCNLLYMITFDSYYQTTEVLHFLSCLTKYPIWHNFQPLIFDLWPKIFVEYRSQLTSVNKIILINSLGLYIVWHVR